MFVEVPGGFKPVAVKVLDESPDSRAGGRPICPVDAKLAIKGTSTLKAVWLGLGAGEGNSRAAKTRPNSR